MNLPRRDLLACECLILTLCQIRSKRWSITNGYVMPKSDGNPQSMGDGYLAVALGATNARSSTAAVTAFG
jgi:hypothetical protein